ncbi:MAG: hypothetical protein V1494_03210 [Candidatus Diapherotrites archaeon]
MPKEQKTPKLAGHLVVCTPLYGAVPVATFNSFLSMLGSVPAFFEKFGLSTLGGTYVQVARRKIAEDVLERDKKDPVDYLLWVDSDSVFSPQDVIALVTSAKETKSDLLSGFYVSKQEPRKAVAYRYINKGFQQMADVPKNTLFNVDAVGFGFLLMKLSVLKALVEKYGLKKAFTVFDEESKEDLGEDLNFCKLAKKEGFNIRLNSAIKIGHAGSVATPDVFYALHEKRG